MNIKIKYIEIFFYILIVLLGFSIVSGPFLADLSVVLIGSFFLFISFYKKLFFFYKNPFVIFFLFFCMYILFGSLISKNIFLSLESSLFYIRYLFLCLAICYFNYKYDIFKTHFVCALIVLISILIFDGIYEFINGSNLLGFIPKTPGRISSFFGDELVIGGFISRISPLLISLIFIVNTNYKKIIIFLLILFSSILVFLSGERSAMIVIIVYLALVFFLISSLRSIVLTVSFFIIFPIIYIITINDNLKNRLIGDTLNDFGFSSSQFYLFSITHQSLYTTAFKMFMDKPFIGHGPKMFRVLCSDEKYTTKIIESVNFSCSSHPHNYYIQLLAETGLIGFLFLITLFVFLIYKIIQSYQIREIKERDQLNLSYLAVIICLLPIIPTGNFFNNWVAIQYFLPIAFILKIKNNKLKI